MKPGSIESFHSEQSPQQLKEELISTIKEGQWRTVIISLDKQGNMQRMFFPLDDKKLRDEEDLAACELISQFTQESHPERTLFGHLRVNKKNQLIVYSSSDAYARPVDETQMNKLLRDYFNGQ